MRAIQCRSSISRSKRLNSQLNIAKSPPDGVASLNSADPHAESSVSFVRITVGESTDWRVRRILSFIDAADGKIGSGMAEICRQLDLGISPDYATKLFKRETGIGFREYGARKRLMKAASQLAETNLSIKVIAADLGYNIPQAFSRRFKFQFQVKPTEYRRQQHV